jgi:hypothetical protein
MDQRRIIVHAGSGGRTPAYAPVVPAFTSSSAETTSQIGQETPVP